MKIKSQIKIISSAILLPFLFSFIFFSCKKKDPVTPAVAKGLFELHLHTNVDTTEVEDYGEVYTMSDGRKISVDLAQLYISGIQLIKTDGSTYDLTGKIVLKKQEEEVYLIDSVPAGNYKSVKFYVGLDASTNSSTPTSGDETLDVPAMWFGASAQPQGFVYVNFSGTIDTTTSATGDTSQMQPFSYKLGTTTAYKQVVMADNAYTVSPNQVQFVHLIVDYAKLFSGVTLNNSANLQVATPADNASTLGVQIGNNISLLFDYEM